MMNLIRSDLSSSYGELIKVLDLSAPQTAGMKSPRVRSIAPPVPTLSPYTATTGE